MTDTIFPTDGKREIAVADGTLKMTLEPGLTATPRTYDKPGGLSNGRQRFTVRGPAGWLHIRWDEGAMHVSMGEAPEVEVVPGG